MRAFFPFLLLFPFPLLIGELQETTLSAQPAQGKEIQKKAIQFPGAPATPKPVPSPQKTPPGKAAPKPIEINGDLTNNEPFDRVRPQSRSKVHIVKMVANCNYIIDLTSASFDSYLRLEDDKGQQLGQDDDSGGYPNARLQFAATRAGNYRVIVTTFGAGQTGKYNLRIRPNIVQAAFFRHADQLTNTDPFDVVRQNCYHKLFNMKFEKGKTYTIDLEGNFDTYLRIEDYRGNQLLQDDDGGQGLNSRIIFRPEETETYRIIATSCGSGAVGNFTLSIRE